MVAFPYLVSLCSTTWSGGACCLMPRVRKSELNTSSAFPYPLHKGISISLFLILVVLILLCSSPFAYAKILPAGQPDIRLDVGAEQRFATSGNFEDLYNDIGKVPQVFDEVMVPGLTRFVEDHWTELEGKDVEWVRMSYSIPSEMSVSVGPAHGTVTIDETSFPELEVVNSIIVRIPTSWWFYARGEHAHWIYSGAQIPNASARIAYLTYQTQDLLTRHQSELTTSVTIDDQGAQIGKLLPHISGIMLEDMSRISASYSEGGYGYAPRMITEYGNGINLLVPLPASTGSLYSPPVLKLNDFILFAKSVNRPLSIHVDLATYDKVSNATLIYPDGKKGSLDLIRVQSEKSESEVIPYNFYRYAQYIEPGEPSGIYKLFIHTLSTSAPPATNLDVSIREGYFPADYDNWAVETISVDNAGYAVRYRIDDDVQVRTIAIDIPKRSVVIEIANAKPDSELTIELPRDLIDSVFEDDADKSFLVTRSDTNSLQHEEILVNDQVRVLTIDLDQNTDLVQIRGTQIVPEFDPVLVLSVSAAAMIGSVLVLQKVKHLRIK